MWLWIFFYNDEMDTNKTTITWPFFFPICTYLTLLYTIEIYKYYKMSLFFYDEQALACYLIPSSISALIIKSVHCRIVKVLATLCRRMCKKTWTGSQILAIYVVHLETQHCSNWLGGKEVKIKINGSESALGTVQQSYLSEASLVRDMSLFTKYCLFWTHSLFSQLVTRVIRLSSKVNHAAAGRLSDECVQGEGGHHDGGAFWFWYMDALSFKRSRHRWQLQLPSGGSDMGGLRQYMWYPLSQSSQNRSWSSFSEVPHMLQHLHSMHCQRYVFTAAIITGVNCRQEGCPERPQSEQDTSSSDWPVLWLVLESPRQKSQ